MVAPVSFGPLRPVEHRETLAPATAANSEGKAAGGSLKAEQAGPKFALGKLTAMAHGLAEAGPPVDHARIAHIRQAIALGHYHIDPSATADAVLRQYDSGKP